MKPTTGKRRLFIIATSLLATLFIVFTIWIIHEANIGRDNILFKTVRATPYGDKIGHFLLAGALTIVVNFFLRHRAFLLKGFPLPYGSLIVLVIVALEEASQHYLPTRSLDIKDALANFAGILVFSIPAIVVTKRIRKN
ncbi:hypothetical protein VDG1235_1274 [Verrucomicrobiia bacterium DG1235]|nr:hypothetical protein VDG1235_1274 [Verrucomicrobiae bacterium DG1235]